MLRRRRLAKQQEDHAGSADAMPLRRSSRAICGKKLRATAGGAGEAVSGSGAQNESAPEVPGRRRSSAKTAELSRGFGVDHLRLGVAVADRNLARLFRLGDLAHEVDVQQAVFEARAFYLDVVGKLEDALE